MKNSSKILFILLALVSLATMSFSLYKIYSIRAEYRTGEKGYQALEELAVETIEPPVEPVTEDETEEVDDLPETPDIAVDFETLLKTSAEVVGWIYCKDTGISYPVMQTDNNEYYLRHLPDGTYSKLGSLFVDCRNQPNFADPNTMIYGHHTKVGAMFAPLLEYKQQEFYEAHPTMFLITPDVTYEVVLFAGFETYDESVAYQVYFEDAPDYGNWLQRMMDRSDFQTINQPDVNHRTLTLSTCSYESDYNRYVVLGQLFELENTEDVQQQEETETN